MQKQHIFETIFTYDNIPSIQYSIGREFGYIEREISMGLNYYFGL